MLVSKPISLATGTTVLIAAVAGRPLYVKQIAFTLTVTGTVQFQDTDGNALTGVMTVTAGQPFVLEARAESSAQDGWFEIASGKGLQSVSTQTVSGIVQYIQ